MAYVAGPIYPSEYNALYELLWRSFERHYLNDSWDWFRPFYENDPFMDEDLVRVVRDGGRIVASVTVFDRRVWIESRRVRMGGIGNVATHPDFRGRGLADLLLDDAIRLMRERGFDVSLLFAGPVGLYEKHGWRSLDAQTYLFRGLRQPKTDAGLVCRPVSWSAEKSKIFGLHKDFVKTRNFAADRNMAYWESYVRGFKNRNCELVGAFRGEDLLAYASVEHNLRERSGWLKEFCWTSESGLAALAGFVVRTCASGTLRITGSGRLNPAVACLRDLAEETVEERNRGFMAADLRGNLEMGSDQFCANILHFSGDDF